MPNQNKSMVIVLALLAAGGVIVYLSMNHSSAPAPQVAMQNVFQQDNVVKSVEQLSKDPVPSPAIVTSPEHGKEAAFAVQVYSFKDQKRADTALVNLKKSGYKNAYIEMSDLGSKGIWYRVRIGGLQNEEKAKSMLESIRKSFNSGIIVKP